MNNVEKGFLGVAAVCAVVAGGWAFWDYGWEAVIDMTREVHGTLYWDLEAEPDEDGDGYVTGLVLTYDWRGEAPEPIWIMLSYVDLRSDVDGTAVLEPGFHSVHLPCRGRVADLDLSDASVIGAFRAVRTSWDSPPAR